MNRNRSPEAVEMAPSAPRLSRVSSAGPPRDLAAERMGRESSRASLPGGGEEDVAGAGLGSRDNEKGGGGI
eukprot:5517184-Pyramimonas_sp.AAC.1